MKNIDTNKLWAFLDAKFSEFGEEYERQNEKARTADNVTAALCRMQGETEKRNFIIDLKNAIISGEFNA